MGGSAYQPWVFINQDGWSVPYPRKMAYLPWSLTRLFQLDSPIFHGKTGPQGPSLLVRHSLGGEEDEHCVWARGVSFSHRLIPDSFSWSLISVDTDSRVHPSHLRTSSKS